MIVAEEFTTDTVTYDKSVNYEGRTVELSMDINIPKSKIENIVNTRKPVVVILHGGGFKSSNYRTPFFTELTAYLCRRGYVVAVPEYRTGWENKNQPACQGTKSEQVFDAMYRTQQDLRSVFMYLRCHADTLGIDTTNIFTFGISAGAIAALSYLYTDTSWVTEERGKRVGGADLLKNNKEHALVAGTMAFSGAFTQLEPNFSIFSPVLLWNGTCDKIVPFTSGRMLGCDNCPVLYGPGEVDSVLLRSGISTEMQIFCGYDHTLSTVQYMDNKLPYTFEYICFSVLEFMYNVMCKCQQTSIKVIQGGGEFAPEINCTGTIPLECCD